MGPSSVPSRRINDRKSCPRVDLSKVGLELLFDSVEGTEYITGHRGHSFLLAFSFGYTPDDLDRLFESRPEEAKSLEPALFNLDIARARRRPAGHRLAVAGLAARITGKRDFHQVEFFLSSTCSTYIRQ